MAYIFLNLHFFCRSLAQVAMFSELVTDVDRTL